jgi:histidinol-phosphate aminotransferase
MYEVSASVNDVETIKVPLNADFQIDTTILNNWISDSYIKLVFICSPNNPTGNAMNHKDVLFILNNFKGIVVIDEAYIDFSDKRSYLDLTDKYNNLIVMQTFSKALGMAAVRIGIAYTNPEIVSLFNRIKPPYNISTINQQAALEKLSRQDEYRLEVLRIKDERNKLIDVLSGLKIIEKVYPTDANFLLVKVSDANSLYNYLVERSIIVRNRNSVINNCIRITIGTPDENEQLVKALKTYAVSENKN